MTTKMQRLADNLINGNLADARHQAKRYSFTTIWEWLVNDLGWTVEKSILAARYLKTGENFQAYCDEK